MVRTVHAETHLLKYLESLIEPKTCKVGLIIGQPVADKDYILHFAKTPPSQTAKNPKPLTSLSEVLEITVGDHAKHTTRMLSGGMYVLGMFIVSHEDVINTSSAKIKSILNYINKRLGKNALMYGNADNLEKLIIHYNGNKCEACSFNMETNKMSSVDLKFIKLPKWLSVKCKYEINETIPLTEEQIGSSIKEQIRKILLSVNGCLKKGIYLYDGEIRSDKEMLVKKRTIGLDHTDDADELEIEASILLPTDCSSLISESGLLETVGFLKISGIIASTVFTQPKASYQMVSQAIKEDIIRSLSTRLTMHFDSLTEGEGGFFNDASSVHEPPRRVFLSMPNNNTMLSDYLFPGEGPQEAQNSFQDVLDITISSKLPMKDLEGQADLTEFYQEAHDANEEEVLPQLTDDRNKFVYIVGGGIAILVLIVSLLLHYLKD